MRNRAVLQPLWACLRPVSQKKLRMTCKDIYEMTKEWKLNIPDIKELEDDDKLQEWVTESKNTNSSSDKIKTKVWRWLNICKNKENKEEDINENKEQEINEETKSTICILEVAFIMVKGNWYIGRVTCKYINQIENLSCEFTIFASYGKWKHCMFNVHQHIKKKHLREKIKDDINWQIYSGFYKYLNLIKSNSASRKKLFQIEKL